jgi:iron complex outermembrane receptor protein
MPFTLTLQSRYVGPAKLYSDLVGTNDPNYSVTTDNSINTDNHVGSYWLFNIAMSYDFDFKNGRKIQMFGVVDNMFDRTPRYAPAITGLGSVSGGGSSVSNPTFYDLVGRRFRIGVRFNY